jgi:hypothetical protein
MDIFSFLPIIIFIYAIVTIFNPGNKNPRNPRTPFPPPETWKEKAEEIERMWFPQEVGQKLPRPPLPKPGRTTRPERTEGRPGWAKPQPFEDAPSSEGYGSEGYPGTEGLGTEGQSGVEGSSGSEGVWGTEGTFGTEGTYGSEGTYGNEGTPGVEGAYRTYRNPPVKGPQNNEILNKKETPPVSPKKGRVTEQKKQANLAGIPTTTQDPIIQGVIWAEVLGKPRARTSWSNTRRH